MKGHQQTRISGEPAFSKVIVRLMLVVGVVLLASTHGHAALLDRSQVDGNGNAESEGGMIDRSLADQIGPGMGDVTTYGSSTYIIKRDPLRSVRRGRQLFQRKFTEAEGLGPRENFHSGGISPRLDAWVPAAPIVVPRVTAAPRDRLALVETLQHSPMAAMRPICLVWT